jgi:hypothetical protein
VAIAGGSYHSLALQADGTVVGWGYDNYGQRSVPVGLSNVVAIAAGEYYSLALQVDGTVVGWGRDNYGQINVPAGLSNVVAIAGGGAHSLALTEVVPMVPQVVLGAWSITNQVLHFQITGVPASHSVVLETSTNLTDWHDVMTNSSVGLPLEFTQPTTNFPQLFLRARVDSH